MQRGEFGSLIKSLRQDVVTPDGRKLTRERFEDLCVDYVHNILGQDTEEAITAHVLNRIERGEKVRLTQSYLLQLANGLGLTSAERERFFAQVADLDHRSVPKGNLRPQDSLNFVVDVLTRSCTPAFVLDQYGDLVLANLSILKLYGVGFDHPLWKEAASRPDGYQMLRAIFARNSPLRLSTGTQWEIMGMDNIRTMRGLTLPVRHTKYWRIAHQHLMNEEEYPDFARMWRESAKDSQDWTKDGTTYNFKHPNFGQVIYASTALSLVTNNGKLQVCTYVPMSNETAELFISLSKTEPHVERVVSLASWPRDISEYQ